MFYDQNTGLWQLEWEPVITGKPFNRGSSSNDLFNGCHGCFSGSSELFNGFHGCIPGGIELFDSFYGYIPGGKKLFSGFHGCLQGVLNCLFP